MSAAQINPPAYVFVAGCGHTGTTLMATILGSHSEIYTIPYETAAFWCADSPQQVEDILQQLWLRQSPRQPIICEKTPSHVHQVERIRAWCPEAKIVLMVRDGRDVVASLKTYAGSLTEAIDRWVHDTTATLRHAGASQTIRIVTYESLIEDPATVIAGICAFVGVDFQERMLQFHAHAPNWFGATVKQPGGTDRAALRNWQVHQPLFDGRGKWRTLLSADDLAQFDRAAGALMRELGYD